MADFEYTDRTSPRDAQGASAGVSAGWVVNLLGGVVSLALVGGVAVWGYKLLVRDVSGVPVVRAIEGPMRVQPEDPGGQQADHQGLAVNAVAALGTAAPTADRVMLAPRPVSLQDEDAPMGKVIPASLRRDVEAAPEIEIPKVTAQTETENPAPADSSSAIDALVQELVSGVKPMTVVSDATEETPDQITAIVQPESLAPAIGDVETETAVDQTQDDGSVPDMSAPVVSGPGLAQSLRPQVRPIQLASAGGAEALADVMASVAASGNEVDPDSLAVGTRLAQLGAYDTPEIARVEWDRLNTQFGDYMDGKARVIEQASSGGRTFYRLRAMGFDDLSDARRFCSALVAENADCIPVIHR